MLATLLDMALVSTVILLLDTLILRQHQCSGFLPLAELPLIRLIGGEQFRKFCVICMIILVATVWTTCWCHEEEEKPRVQRPQGQA